MNKTLSFILGIVIGALLILGGIAVKNHSSKSIANKTETTEKQADSPITSFDEEMMRRAVELSKNSVLNAGGPFGAVIVKEGKVVGEASNCVTLHNDPTAHAEVSAIRNACDNLGTFDLSGCVIYTSCYPCPMCLGAIYWAHIEKIYYGNNALDAAEIGFDDAFIYSEIDKDPSLRTVKEKSVLHEEALEAFKMWREKTDKTEY